MREIVLEKIEIKDSAANVVGHSIVSVNVDDLLSGFQGKTDEERKQTLRNMGYERYFDRLRREAGFEWL